MSSNPAPARLRWKVQVVTIVVVLANTLGNFFLAWGMKHKGTDLNLSLLSYLSALANPFVALGILLLIAWLLLRMALLGMADLSYVIPVTAVGYVLNAVMGRLFLNESITLERWGGTLLIVLGTMLVATGSAHGERSS